MRIAFLVPGFPRLSETFILNQITGLLDLGCDVRIFSQTRPNEQRLHPDVETYRLLTRTTYLDYPEGKPARVLSGLRLLQKHLLRTPSVVLNAMDPLKFGKDAVSLRLLHWATPFLDGFDVIMCHFGQAGIVGAQLVRAGVKSKLVTMFHGYDIRVGLEQGGHIYADLFRHGDLFLSISSYNRENLIRLGADSAKIVHHPVGIDLRTFSPLESARPNEHRTIVILSVARLVWEKAIEHGIRAVATMLRRKPGLKVQYRISGGGVLEAELKRLTTELGLDDVVRFCGPMTQQEIVEELRNADIFLLPSVAEALPVCLMEAQAMKLPVVATNVGSVSEVVRHGESGFVVPAGDVEEMAGALLRLVEHPETWSDLGARGRAHISNDYDVQKLNERLLERFRRLTTASPSGS